MSQEDSIKQLIKDFRKCKTQAEEREFIVKKRAQIRLNIKDWAYEEKANAILQLIWINMKNYETNFAQVESMNVLFYENFRSKIIGYLGLTLFLSEKSEVLMMATNRIRLDLESNDNFFVIALALKAFTEIADKNMTGDLFRYIMDLLDNDSKYIKKKAILACLRVLQKQPELVTELKSIIPHLLNEKNHGLLLCSLHLSKTILSLKPEYIDDFKGCLPNLFKTIENISKEYSSTYTLDKINDPILQVTILSFIKTIAIKDSQVCAEFGNLMLLIYNNIKNNSSSAALCLMYELARCIMQIDSSHALKRVGIQILGKFLEMQHSNNLYLSLRMLYYASSRYKEEVAKYNNLIQKCVSNEDYQIKRLSIQILKNIVNQENINQIFHLILRKLKQQKDPKEQKELFSTLLIILEKNPINLVWFEKKVLLLLESIQEKANDKDLFNFYDVIQNYSELQMFFLYRSVLLLSKVENRGRETLAKTASWVIGEFGELLEDTEDIQSLNIEKILSIYKLLPIHQYQNTTIHSLINSLCKLYSKLESEEFQKTIKDILNSYLKLNNPLIKIKIHQSLNLLKLEREMLQEILEPVPVCTVNEIFEGIEIGRIDKEQLNKNAEEFNRMLVESEVVEEVNDLDFMNMEIQQNQQEEKIQFQEIKDDQIPQQVPEVDFFQQDEQPVNQDTNIDFIDFTTEENTKKPSNDPYDIMNLENQQTQELDPFNIINDQDQGETQEIPDPYQEMNLLGKTTSPEKPQQPNPYDQMNILNQDEEEFVEQEVEEENLIQFYHDLVISLKYSMKIVESGQVLMKIYIFNNSSENLTNFNIKIALKKSFKILSNQLSQTTIKSLSQGEVFMSLLMQNVGESPVIDVRLKFSYSKNGQHVEHSTTLAKVPLI